MNSLTGQSSSGRGGQTSTRVTIQQAHDFSRCLLDSLPDPAGAGRNASPAAGVCHRPASPERQRGSVEVHQPIPDRHWYANMSGNITQYSNILQLLG